VSPYWARGLFLLTELPVLTELLVLTGSPVVEKVFLFVEALEELKAQMSPDRVHRT